MTETADLLKAHVHELAARIGERNVSCAAALAAAAAYIRRTWIDLGYEDEMVLQLADSRLRL